MTPILAPSSSQTPKNNAPEGEEQLLNPYRPGPSEPGAPKSPGTDAPLKKLEKRSGGGRRLDLFSELNARNWQKKENGARAQDKGLSDQQKRDLDTLKEEIVKTLEEKKITPAFMKRILEEAVTM